MKGYILTYHNALSKRDIINTNYNLFGKVLSKQGKKYFYKGLLDDCKAYKFSNGCYFLKLAKPILEQLVLDDRVQLYTCEIELSALSTIRALKQEQYKHVFVKHLQ